MATDSSTLAWKMPWMEEPGRCSPWGPDESNMTEQLHFQFSLSCIGERNGNPLQCSCLENPRDGGAWWAAVSGVAQSRTRLKRLSSSSPKPSLDPACSCLISFLLVTSTFSTTGFMVHYLLYLYDSHRNHLWLIYYQNNTLLHYKPEER